MSGTFTRFLGCLVLAMLIGAGGAVFRLKLLDSIDDVRVGPWRSSSLIGSPQASPMLRALVAVNGILALNHAQAIYFTASADDDGQPLTGACQYRVVGHDLPARWWSVTAYGADRFLIPNAQHRYSATRDSVSRDADGAFAITIGTQPQPGDWIATQPGHFLLTLRAYAPEAILSGTPPSALLPRIERAHCA